MFCLFIPPSHQPPDLFFLISIVLVLPFPECYVLGIKQNIAISDWLLSLSNMPLWFLHLSSWLVSSFFFSAVFLSGCTTVYPFTNQRTSCYCCRCSVAQLCPNLTAWTAALEGQGGLVRRTSWLFPSTGSYE